MIAVSRNIANRLLRISLLLVLNACAVVPDASVRREQIITAAAAVGWQQQIIPSGDFDLASFVPASIAAQQRLVIYLEGDGLAWINSSRPSSDPTPITALALQLAQKHPSPNAVYLARPCQYVTVQYRQNCRQSVWTSAQFSESVIQATSNAIDILKQRYQSKMLVLVGYSGGGVVAALVAARRDDVVRLVTVASNLDHRYWTTLHQITPLSGSLNPTDFYQQLASIPQLHLAGAKDKVVPPAVIEKFVNGFKQKQLVTIKIMRGFDHQCCWLDDWLMLLPGEAIGSLSASDR